MKSPRNQGSTYADAYNADGISSSESEMYSFVLLQQQLVRNINLEGLDIHLLPLRGSLLVVVVSDDTFLCPLRIRRKPGAIADEKRGWKLTLRAWGLLSPSSSPLNKAASSSPPSPSFLSLPPRRLFFGSPSSPLRPGSGRVLARLFLVFFCSFSSSLSFSSSVHFCASSRANLRCSASSSACCRSFSCRSR